ncbi:hypothetical protein B9Z55_020531 [Caenorhabditis nigoni]|uniref:Uncharacterized protein n=1 Tax=Caenorhabditis nigoni TaxID=1611254 RepID=A0A2G5TN65_9PELO|nr:hypothetical protein B9Z55_020531 [Caenorhabditis nigoni]
MDVFTVATPVIVISFLSFLTLRLIIKYCKPSQSAVVSSSDTEAPDFTRVANHLFVSNTPHTCTFFFFFIFFCVSFSSSCYPIGKVKEGD